MDELETRPKAVVTDEQRLTYAGMYVLKKMDLSPEDGGMVFPLVMPSELTPLDEVFQELLIAGLVEMNHRKNRYQLTKQGLEYLGSLIDEAAALVEEFEEEELADAIAELRARNLDVFRARFLWGWYDGELDDLALFQQRRGISPIETLWAYYLTGDELYEHLARDLK